MNEAPQSKGEKKMTDSLQKMMSSGTLIMIMDMVTSVICSIFAVFIVRWLSDPFGSLKHFVFIWSLVSVAASFIAFIWLKTYNISVLHSTYRSIGKLAAATFIKESILFLIVLLRLVVKGFYRTQLMVLTMDLFLTICTLVILRVFIIAIYQSVTSSPQNNVFKMASMVCGINTKSISIVTRLAGSQHYNVIGFLTSNKSNEGIIIDDKRVYCISSIADFHALKMRYGIDCVIFPPHASEDPDYDTYVGYCAKEGVQMMMAPDLDAVQVEASAAALSMPMSAAQASTVEANAAAPLAASAEAASAPAKPRKSAYTSPSTIALKNPYTNDEYVLDGMSSFERNVKRIVDCILASILLIIFSPLFLVCYIAIKASDGGPAIYAQERIGRFGRPFKIYKFRSMRVDAEKFGPALYSGEKDPRLTKVGSFLRQHHLDELPQLWNVFVGDMAFVGPRPERKFYIDQIMAVDSRYYFLYQIRPGVTSYATFYNGYTDTLEKMLRRLDYDIYYLRNRSWWLDIKILAKTFLNIVFGNKF